MKDYADLDSLPGEWPTQRSVEAVFKHAIAAEVHACQAPDWNVYTRLLRVDARREIKALHAALAITEVPRTIFGVGMRTPPDLRIVQNNGLVRTITFYGMGIVHLGDWKSSARLAYPDAFTAWLDRHGLARFA